MTKNKKSKLATPGWIFEGYKSKEDYNKSKGLTEKKKTGKTFKVRKCPECGSDNVGVVLGLEEEGKGRGEWECRACDWRGFNVDEKEMSEDEFLKFLD